MKKKLQSGSDALFRVREEHMERLSKVAFDSRQNNQASIFSCVSRKFAHFLRNSSRYFVDDLFLQLITSLGF